MCLHSFWRSSRVSSYSSGSAMLMTELWIGDEKVVGGVKENQTGQSKDYEGLRNASVEGRQTRSNAESRSP